MSTSERQVAKTIGILYQEHSDGADNLAETLTARLEAEGRAVWREALQKHDRQASDRLPGTDIVLVLGGDGSLLSAARMCAESGIPLLGINFGRVGFLTELEPAEPAVTQVLPQLLLGQRRLLPHGAGALQQVGGREVLRVHGKRLSGTPCGNFSLSRYAGRGLG